VSVTWSCDTRPLVLARSGIVLASKAL